MKKSTYMTEKSKKTKYSFFLNSYDDVAFSKCPKCENKTLLRKFPLVIHIEPKHLLVLNKTCRFCTKCDLIIARKSKLEALMATHFENADPEILGNDYLVMGTLEKSDWRKFSKETTYPNEAIERIYIFKEVLNFELVRAGWYREGNSK